MVFTIILVLSALCSLLSALWSLCDDEAKDNPIIFGMVFRIILVCYTL
jgi:hypothetical protein